ncbi:MAG: response regulator [Leptolyngbyaceae cyanobacterium SL_7_1]|nr:response regulator [Leptolyngbyaceae cyanobacterium SL_7_1]
MTAPTPSPKRVLVIDDEAHIREVVQVCLECLSGWTVQVAASGEAGLAKAVESPPDLIVLDLMMPEMNGLSFLERLRVINLQVPVVLLTAKANLIEPSILSKLQVVEAIAKPFDPVNLARQLAELLE